jgi:hypothetical protein
MFDGLPSIDGEYNPESHLAQMISILEKLPAGLLGSGKYRTRYFNAAGKPKPLVKQHVVTFTYFWLGDLLNAKIPAGFSLDQFVDNPNHSEHGRVEFLEFLKSMIKLLPRERLSSQALLESPWVFKAKP